MGISTLLGDNIQSVSIIEEADIVEVLFDGKPQTPDRLNQRVGPGKMPAMNRLLARKVVFEVPEGFVLSKLSPRDRAAWSDVIEQKNAQRASVRRH